VDNFDDTYFDDVVDVDVVAVVVDDDEALATVVTVVAAVAAASADDAVGRGKRGTAQTTGVHSDAPETDSCFHRSGDRTVEETGERQEEAGNQGDRRRDILGTRNPGVPRCC